MVWRENFLMKETCLDSEKVESTLHYRVSRRAIRIYGNTVTNNRKKYFKNQLKSLSKLPDSGPELLGFGFGRFEILKCPSLPATQRFVTWSATWLSRNEPLCAVRQKVGVAWSFSVKWVPHGMTSRWENKRSWRICSARRRPYKNFLERFHAWSEANVERSR